MEPAPRPPSPGQEVPRWLWLWLPPLIIPAQILLKARSERAYRTWMRGEIGVVELATVTFLLIAFGLGIALLRRPQAQRLPFFRPWIALLTLGCLYFGGEEASWGQHYFGWATPEAWRDVNEQQETNLHNTIGLLDQAPRFVLGMAALLGGIVLPLYFARGERARRWASHPLAWTVPTIVVLPAAAFSLLVNLPKSIFKLIGQPLPAALEFSAGETKEYFFGLFLMLYMLSLWRRLRRAELAAPDQRLVGADPSC